MELWAIVTIVIGSLGALGIASFFAPGVAQYVVTVFTTLFNLLRQAVQFVLDHAPKPLKILIFLGLFAMIGVFAYNFSVGAQYVCTGDGVGKVSYLEGVALMLVPQQDPWEAEKAVNAEIDAETLKPLQVTSITTDDEDLMFQTERVWFGRSYDVMYALMPRTDVTSSISESTFYDLSDAELWQRYFFRDGDMVIYDICLDRETNTCVLERADFVGSGSQPCRPESGRGIFSNVNDYIWETGVGNIRYYVRSDGSLYGEFKPTAGSNPFASAIAEPFSTQVDRCGVIDSVLYQELLDGEVDGVSEDEISGYRQVIGSEFGYLSTTLTDTDLLFDDEYAVTLYDVTYSPIAKIEKDNATVSTGFDTYDPVTGDFADTRRCTGEDSSQCDVYQLVSSAEPVSFSRYDSFSVTCNDETDDPFDTKPLLLGVDILNWKIMALFVLLGSMFSFYAWINSMR